MKKLAELFSEVEGLMVKMNLPSIFDKTYNDAPLLQSQLVPYNVLVVSIARKRAGSMSHARQMSRLNTFGRVTEADRRNSS